MRKWYRYIWGVLVMTMLGSGACSFAPNPSPPLLTRHNGFLPPPTFQETDLIGTWQSIFTRYQVNTLILSSDHRFIQRFDTTSPDDHYEGEGTWHVERRASGCVYLHLEGMRFFGAGKDFGANGHRHTPYGTPYYFLERCENQRIPMPDKLILVVAERPTWARRIGLSFPVTSSPAPSEETLTIVIDAQGQPILPPSPARR